MIPIGSLARFVLGIALDSAKDRALDSAKKAAVKDQLGDVKKLIAEEIARAYSLQTKALSEGYIKAIQDSSLEIEISKDDSKGLVISAEKAINKLEVYLKEQNPEGPIIQFLQERYKEEKIKIITGKLYAAHYVFRQGQGAYKIYNKMGYAPLVDKNRPWLSGDKTSQGIGELIAEKADQLFQEAFDADFTE
jgi:hypothetical protein